MTREEAEKYANNMTYRDAINNLMKARCIPYRKATFIKVNELLKALEQEPYDDAKYHEEHGEVVVDKAVWEDAKRALEQEPSGDLISRQAVHETIEKWAGSMAVLVALPTREVRPLLDSIHKLPSVNPQEKTGHCEDCKYFSKLPYHADTLGKCFHHGGFCPKGDWYCADFEPQERSDKE